MMLYIIVSDSTGLFYGATTSKAKAERFCAENEDFTFLEHICETVCTYEKGQVHILDL